MSWTVPKEGAKLDTDGAVDPQGPARERAALGEGVRRTSRCRPEGQQVWCNGLGLPPVRPGLEPPADLVGDPAYPTTEEDLKLLLRVPTPVLVEHESEWFAKVNEIMQG